MKVACRVCVRRQLLWAEKLEVVDDGRRGEEERRPAAAGVGIFPILAVLFFGLLFRRFDLENSVVQLRRIGGAAVSSFFASFFGINVACGDLAGVGVAKFPARLS